MPLVFVYGTLMRAGANHAVLQRLGAVLVGGATTCEPRTLVDLGPYPALVAPGVLEARATRVSGELWEVDDEALRELDEFEGCPELYVRERIRVATAGGVVEAFGYVFARRLPAGARVIVTGRYAAAGSVLSEGAAPEQIEPTAVGLDNEPPTEEGSPPRRPKRRAGPR